APVGAFYTQHTDSRARVLSWRRTTAEQALIYRDRRAEYVSLYAGEYILLQDGEVVWHGEDGSIRVSRRELARDRPDQAMWLKYVDPEEAEGEHFEVYEQALAHMPPEKEA
ncbi:MAG: hypothetical protein JXC32_14020, partial [Anaerolineae bacterium]|nr:hypothetical protein [Anaerolineae bacterium]